MEKPIARAVTFFVSRIQIKHKKIHLALGHTWHSVILGTRSTWHSVILGTRSTWHSVTLGTRSLGTRSTWHSVTWHSVPTFVQTVHFSRDQPGHLPVCTDSTDIAQPIRDQLARTLTNQKPQKGDKHHHRRRTTRALYRGYDMKLTFLFQPTSNAIVHCVHFKKCTTTIICMT